MREKADVPADLNRDQLQECALAMESVQALISGKTVVKVIAVPGKLVNIVVKG